MLDKARREYQRLTERFDIDNLFNFFVTAYHVSDYIRKTGAVAQVKLDTFLQDQDIKDCRDICDKGKHLALSQRPDPITRVWRGGFNGAPYNTLPFNGGDKWVLFSGDRKVDVKRLAERVLSKWEAFFAANGL
jgi:hypothetical protein